MENGGDTADAARPRMSLLSAKRKHQSVEPKAKTQRWRTSQQAEDYVSLVADMMAPSVTFGAYGYDHEQVPRIVAPRPAAPPLPRNPAPLFASGRMAGRISA